MATMSRNALRKWGVGLALVLVAALVEAGGLSADTGKPTEEALAQVKIGMPRTEVDKLLGDPDLEEKTTDAPELCRLYVYKKVGRYRIVNIWFDCGDKVKEIDKIQ